MLQKRRARARSGALVPLSELAHFCESTRDAAIHRKDMLPVVYYAYHWRREAR